jgi:hypothetical protein
MDVISAEEINAFEENAMLMLTILKGEAYPQEEKLRIAREIALADALALTQDLVREDGIKMRIAPENIPDAAKDEVFMKFVMREFYPGITDRELIDRTIDQFEIMLAAIAKDQNVTH